MLRIENGSTGVYVATMEQYVSPVYLLMLIKLSQKESPTLLSIRTGGCQQKAVVAEISASKQAYAIGGVAITSESW